MVDEPRTNNQKSPAPPSVAVHAHLAAFRKREMEKVHNLHHVLEGGRSHVLPTLVETPDAMGEKFLRNVTEPNGADDSVATKGMLPGFLQVEHSANVVLFELGIQAVLLDEPLRGPLHGENVLRDPV